jgi:hypothetical protein
MKPRIGDVVVFTNPEWARYGELGVIKTGSPPNNVAYEDVDRSRPSYGIATDSRMFEEHYYMSWVDFCIMDDFEVIDHDESLLEGPPTRILGPLDGQSNPRIHDGYVDITPDDWNQEKSI